MRQLKDNKQKRMAFVLKKTATAITVTSLTTTGAFLSNMISEIMPIKSFGLYAAIIIPINFILTVLLFPPILVVYDEYLSQIHYC